MGTKVALSKNLQGLNCKMKSVGTRLLPTQSYEFVLNQYPSLDTWAGVALL